MNSGGIALLVAVVGVAGTLLAPVTTTWVGSRARLQEFELQQRADQAARLFEEAQQNLERRRDTYVALNTSARAYRILLMEDLQALRRGAHPGANGDTEASRVEFQSIYAQAQMLVPDAVLETCQAVRVALADARKQLTALLEDTTLDLEKWQDVHTHLIQLWDVIGAMQRAMRQDLGITTPPTR
ncbi:MULTISPECIES: hypothetical protein [unclassified Streptomyces]|uniref:hypothetical protein n=1 Tax=unclassified Streptomyces TaxID=2593676 RepID=UPI0033FB53A6